MSNSRKRKKVDQTQSEVKQSTPKNNSHYYTKRYYVNDDGSLSNICVSRKEFEGGKKISGKVYVNGRFVQMRGNNKKWLADSKLRRETEERLSQDKFKPLPLVTPPTLNNIPVMLLQNSHLDESSTELKKITARILYRKKMQEKTVPLEDTKVTPPLPHSPSDTSLIEQERKKQHDSLQNQCGVFTQLQVTHLERVQLKLPTEILKASFEHLQNFYNDLKKSAEEMHVTLQIPAPIFSPILEQEIKKQPDSLQDPPVISPQLKTFDFESVKVQKELPTLQNLESTLSHLQKSYKNFVTRIASEISSSSSLPIDRDRNRLFTRPQQPLRSSENFVNNENSEDNHSIPKSGI